VRIAPNEISISTVTAAKDIYGHASKGRSTFLKSEFYRVGNEAPSIVRERDPQKHQEVRRHLSHGFSAKALRLQTDLVIQYVDLFVKQIEKLGNVREGIRMDEWYNWVTFDIIGDLAFGESFNAVAEGKRRPFIPCVSKLMS
jgi:cytochrome P450